MDRCPKCGPIEEMFQSSLKPSSALTAQLNSRERPISIDIFVPVSGIPFQDSSRYLTRCRYGGTAALLRSESQTLNS